jgi:hypothetical protein
MSDYDVIVKTYLTYPLPCSGYATYCLEVEAESEEEAAAIALGVVDPCKERNASFMAVRRGTTSHKQAGDL